MTKLRGILYAFVASVLFVLGTASPAAAHTDSAYSGWTRGFDFSWDKPTAAQVKASGGSYVMVYISPTSSTGKHASAAQIQAYRDAGIGVGLIYETTDSRAKGGCTAGRADAVAVNVALARLGLPLDSVVYSGAIDFDTYPAIMGTIASYLDCQVSVRGGKDRVGVYGDYDVIEKANWWGYTRLWQTYAWSSGKWSGAADLCQVHNGWKVSGHDTDLNYSADTTTIGLLGQATIPQASPGSQRASVTYTGSAAAYPTVRYGDRGKNVRALQGALYDRGWKIKVDGVFGAGTLKIVKAFQRDKGLTADGIAGPITWACVRTCSVT